MENKNTNNENKKPKNDSVSRSWFCVFNNPQDHGYPGSPEEVIARLKEEWSSLSPSHTGAWTYCISAQGLPHVHMVLEDVKPMRFSAIKKAYAPGMHFTPTKGTKEEAEDYITKRGKYEDKGETVLCTERLGEIKGCQGQRKVMEILEEFIASGKTPREILKMSLSYRKYEDVVVSHFREKRRDEIGHMRDVNVVWHFGNSGSGKSYFSNTLIEKYGRNNVYFMSDYGNGCFDNYMCEPVLFLDEYRNQFQYEYLLSLLDKYVSEVHARYHNVSTLWNEVHITSVKTPDEVYNSYFRDAYERSAEPFQQLRRRIDTIMYHWIDDTGFRQFSLPMAEYVNRDDMVLKAARSSGGFFIPLPPGITTPFDK